FADVTQSSKKLEREAAIDGLSNQALPINLRPATLEQQVDIRRPTNGRDRVPSDAVHREMEQLVGGAQPKSLYAAKCKRLGSIPETSVVGGRALIQEPPVEVDGTPTGTKEGDAMHDAERPPEIALGVRWAGPTGFSERPQRLLCRTPWDHQVHIVHRSRAQFAVDTVDERRAFECHHRDAGSRECPCRFVGAL